jgi:hypothetical protein
MVKMYKHSKVPVQINQMLYVQNLEYNQ